ncbi:diguanylate cyclase [Pseudodesulfovibrio sp. JC047]|uniref:GGDEF domain-containing protein n=1 Tax=Pseudodesulfovibrio sp. JC047 TaxID=2683199 RepID=UPI0013D5107D|nr:GGDEF domain-containing protein [Pseudodesulfovibrio sp. JC047]NDV20913.1 diguanylate cyclase [Pseudodesulfovibrio sp. JC047]
MTDDTVIQKTFCSAETKRVADVLKEAGIGDDPDWLAIILFIRNLLGKLSIYSDEKKAEIQREVCAEILKNDFSQEHYAVLIAMLDMFIMQNIGTQELEAALTKEKRSATLLIQEMNTIINSMQGAHTRHNHRLDSFKQNATNVIQGDTDRSAILTKVRGMFKELIIEFKDEARELNAKAEHFERTANFDPLLTQLYNRRAMEAFLAGAIKECTTDARPLSLMMIDVDHFKRVNDTYGHQAGDDVLRALARILTAHAMQYDGFAARYGGEELVIIMKDMDKSRATIKAEAVRADVANYDFRVRTNGTYSADPLQFTVSIGVAELHSGWKTSELICAADTALYEAKDAGRNVVRVAPSK